MIKFFRKIRQKLLSENKFSKYLIYAIGEIVLVVIGILIALSINNWNENKKIRNLEIDILKEIKTSPESDLLDIKKSSNFLKDKFKSENIVINWIESKAPFHDSLSKHINKIQFGIEFRYKGASYKTLNQLGLRIVKNDSLRNQISSLYDLSYNHYNSLVKYQNDAIKEIQNLEAKHYNETGFLKQNIMKPTDIVALKKDNELLSRMKSIRNYNEYIFKIIIPQVESNIIKTKNMIEEEIILRNHN